MADEMYTERCGCGYQTDPQPTPEAAKRLIAHHFDHAVQSGRMLASEGSVVKHLRKAKPTVFIGKIEPRYPRLLLGGADELVLTGGGLTLRVTIEAAFDLLRQHAESILGEDGLVDLREGEIIE